MKDALVAYFSANPTGSSITKQAAEMAAAAAGADLYVIAPARSYGDDRAATIQIAQEESNAKYRPDIKGPLPDVRDYNTILLGFPNWSGTAPMAVFTFLDKIQEKGDLTGKRIIPFVISEGSGMQNGLEDLKKAYPEAVIDEYGSFLSDDIASSPQEVYDWIQEVF